MKLEMGTRELEMKMRDFKMKEEKTLSTVVPPGLLDGNGAAGVRVDMFEYLDDRLLTLSYVDLNSNDI